MVFKGSSSHITKWVPLVIAQSVIFLCMLHNRSSNCILPEWKINNDYDIDAPIFIHDSKKTESFSTATTVLPPNPQIYFIHVGKAGGMTLHDSMQLVRTIREVQCLVNRTLSKSGPIQKNDTSPAIASVASTSCQRRFTPRASQLEKSIAGYFHMMGILLTPNERSWLMNNTNVFLFTVRDPIARLVSTYNYHRSGLKDATKFQFHDRFYKECFPDGLDDMVNVLRKNAKPTCTPLGMNALTGRTLQGGWHFMYNYTHYKNYTMDQSPDHAVAVVRTEHLWDDIVHLDKLLGGSGNFGNKVGSKHTHGSENYTVSYDDDLSISNTIFLCCLIYKDLESYQIMILRALNLEYGQKLDVLNDLLNRCQVGGASEDTSDLVKDPFSWENFRRSEICHDSLGNFNKFW